MFPGESKTDAAAITAPVFRSILLWKGGRPPAGSIQPLQAEEVDRKHVGQLQQHRVQAAVDLAAGGAQRGAAVQGPGGQGQHHGGGGLAPLREHGAPVEGGDVSGDGQAQPRPLAGQGEVLPQALLEQGGQLLMIGQGAVVALGQSSPVSLVWQDFSAFYFS